MDAWVDSSASEEACWEGYERCFGGVFREVAKAVTSLKSTEENLRILERFIRFQFENVDNNHLDKAFKDQF